MHSNLSLGIAAGPHGRCYKPAHFAELRLSTLRKHLISSILSVSVSLAILHYVHEGDLTDLYVLFQNGFSSYFSAFLELFEEPEKGRNTSGCFFLNLA